MLEHWIKATASLLSAALLVGACTSKPLDSGASSSGGSGGGGGSAGSGGSVSQPDPNRGGRASAECLGDGVSDLGEPCPCASDCKAGLYCLAEKDSSAPQGECTLPCSDDSTCPTEGGWYCYKFDPSDSLGICTQHCKASSDCTSPDRHWCFFGDCTSACERDNQCLSGHCNPGTFMCDDGTPNGDAPLLAACLRDQDCASGKCVGTPGTCQMLCPPDRDVCPKGSVCEDGGCDPLCTSTSECPKPWLCLPHPGAPEGQRTCWRRDPVQVCTNVPADVGEPCGCDADCADGLPCQAANALVNVLPFGACVVRCDLFDEGTGLRCPQGLHCVASADPDPATNNNGICVPSCAGPSDCKAGRICSTELGCEPFCQSDADCAGTGKTPAEDYPCNLYQGSCLNFTPAGKTLGETCTKAADCMSGICASGDGKTHFCSANCSVVGQKCPDKGVCIDSGDNDLGLCVPSCKVSTDCPGGLTCLKGACVKG